MYWTHVLLNEFFSNIHNNLTSIPINVKIISSPMKRTFNILQFTEAYLMNFNELYYINIPSKFKKRLFYVVLEILEGCT
jgi:hypothetical protein